MDRKYKRIFYSGVTSDTTYEIENTDNFKHLIVTNNYFGNALFSNPVLPSEGLKNIICASDANNTNALNMQIQFVDKTHFKVGSITTKGAWAVETFIIYGVY